MDNTQLLEQIKRYSTMNKLVFFVGAGVSKLSGFPSWYELVKSMGDEINYNYKKTYDAEGKEVTNISPDEFLKIPEMYYIKFGDKKYNEKVKNSFANKCVPNEIHNLIMSLHPNHILTTNYDNLIEDAATKFGENYSVIASDKDISEAETIRYLLKVHGDFSRNFVLKESDYLNYEFDYQLISNLMKSIFATNLVVFIGYSLDDYNIKLILNWMLNVQKDNFVKPVFINTDNKKNDTEKNYYLGKGIHVLDSNDFVTDEEDSFQDKYRNVLNSIAKFSSTPKIDNKQKVLDFLYSEIIDIRNTEYIKRSDFNRMFSGDFKINDEWKIEQSHISQIDNLWKDYFDHKSQYIDIDEQKCNQIDSFINACNIKGIHSAVGLCFPEIKINNHSFNGDYDEILQYCSLECKDIEEQFRKAYYLSRTGRMEESYSLFTEVLKSSKASKDWDVYYLAQINRYHLYRKIDYARTYYAQPLTIFSTGQRISVIDEHFFREMYIEMANCIIESQFDELPYYFKSRYGFFAKFAKSNCFSDEVNDLMKNKYEIEKSLTSDTVSMGLSKFDKIKLDMLEAVKFIEDNMIYVQGYEESKNYIKNALFIWLRAYDKEVNKKASGSFGYVCSTRLKFECQDILLLSKSCNKDDLRYFEENISFNKIPFDEVEKLKNHVLKLIAFYKLKFNDEILMSEYLWWREICSELQALLRISSHYLKTENVALEIVEFILDCNDGYWMYQDRMSIVHKYITKDNASNILKALEVHLISKLEKYIEKNAVEFDNISSMIRTMAFIVSYFSYEFTELSNFIIAHQESKQLISSAIIPLASNLSVDAKDLILENYKIENVWQLIERSKVDSTLDIMEFSYLIESYLENEIVEMSIPGVKKYTVPPQEEYIRKIIYFIIENDIVLTSLSKYRGYWSEFDYFFNIDDFNPNDFDVDWLLVCTDKVLSYIKENEPQYLLAKEALRNMDKSKCKVNVETWIYLYGTLI